MASAHYNQPFVKLIPGMRQGNPTGTTPRIYPGAPDIIPFTRDFAPGFDPTKLNKFDNWRTYDNFDGSRPVQAVLGMGAHIPHHLHIQAPVYHPPPAPVAVPRPARSVASMLSSAPPGVSRPAPVPPSPVIAPPSPATPSSHKPASPNTTALIQTLQKPLSPNTMSQIKQGFTAPPPSSPFATGLSHAANYVTSMGSALGASLGFGSPVGGGSAGASGSGTSGLIHTPRPASRSGQTSFQFFNDSAREAPHQYAPHQGTSKALFQKPALEVKALKLQIDPIPELPKPTLPPPPTKDKRFGTAAEAGRKPRAAPGKAHQK